MTHYSENIVLKIQQNNKSGLNGISCWKPNWIHMYCMYLEITETFAC